jgi:hypothetical protein
MFILFVFVNQKVFILQNFCLFYVFVNDAILFRFEWAKTNQNIPLKTKEIINRDSYSIKKVSWIKKGYRYSWGFMDLGIQTGRM